MNPLGSVDFRRKWHVMAAVGSGVFLATLDSSIINVSLPTLVRALNARFSTVQWVVLAYLLTVTTSMLTFGRVGDMLGKKRIYLTGFIIFTLGSAMCGIATSIYWLIGFRVLQAIGSAMIMALGAAIVTEAFPPSERGKAMGIIGAIVSIGIVVGPAVGGLIIGTLSWRWIFYVNLPVGIVGSFIVIRNIPDFKPGERQSFDYWGALVLFLSLLSLLLALTLGGQDGFFKPAPELLLLSWLLFLMLFLLIEIKSAHPMIDLKMFQNTLFSMGLATGFIAFIALAGILVLIPFYLEDMLKYQPLQVGLLMGIVPLMLGVASPISGVYSDRLGTRLLTVVGLAIMVAGYLAAGTLNAQTSALGYAGRMFALGLGMGIFLSPNNSAIMGTAPRSRLGIVSGFLAITRTLGQTVGVAVMGAIWAGRTALHAGGNLQDGATNAPIAAQVAALQDTLQVAAALIVVALFIAIWALWKGSRKNKKTHDHA
jgi:EmrB/QacA subfamily drug resistance transporter